jgi:hypothetical protein
MVGRLDRGEAFTAMLNLRREVYSQVHEDEDGYVVMLDRVNPKIREV